MPLSSRFTDETAAGRGAAKDGQWQRHGYGPWAVLVEGEFAGWGGFRREEYGLRSCLPAQWGRDRETTLAALRRGFGELGLDEVSIALLHTSTTCRSRFRKRLVWAWPAG
jgi:ribosomal-protein-alanine N-acetyltransferase